MKSKKRKFNFGFEFQIDLITMMVRSISFLLLCKKLVKPEFFTGEKFQFFVAEIYKFYDKYEQLADQTILKSFCKDKADRLLVKRIFRNRMVKEDFIRDKVEDFVKRSLFIDYHVESAELYNKNSSSPDKAYDFMMSGMEEILKINMREDHFHFLHKDFENRITERENKIQTKQTFKVRTGINPVDRYLKGGVSGGEVAMFLADAKAGKSLGLIHMGNEAVKRFIPTMHVQLEGKVDQTMDRYDAGYLGAYYDDVVKNEMPKELFDKMKRISEKRKYKDLIVRGYEDWDSCSILDIERDFLELRSRGYEIKLVIIDYMDLMRARKSYSDERFRQQSIIRDIKSFAVKYNVAVWTATQAHRLPEESRNDPNYIITSKNIAEDYGKVRAIDILLTINVTDEEMKKGIARLWLDLVRDNPAKKLIRIKRALDRSLFHIPKGMKQRIESEEKTKFVKRKKKPIKKPAK